MAACRLTFEAPALSRSAANFRASASPRARCAPVIRPKAYACAGRLSTRARTSTCMPPMETPARRSGRTPGAARPAAAAAFCASMCLASGGKKWPQKPSPARPTRVSRKPVSPGFEAGLLLRDRGCQSEVRALCGSPPGACAAAPAGRRTAAPWCRGGCGSGRQSRTRRTQRPTAGPRRAGATARSSVPEGGRQRGVDVVGVVGLSGLWCQWMAGRLAP
eukprot:scaffold3865_cov61-Phaeocystis_antarctica.AAC.3